MQVIAEAISTGIILAHFPKEAESVVTGLSLEPGAELCGIVCRELGDLLALLHDERSQEPILAVIRRPKLIAVSIEPMVKAPAKRNLRELAEEHHVLLVDLSGGHRLDLREEAIYRGQGQARKNLLDQIIDHADHLFMLALLALPDEINQGFVEYVAAESLREHSQDGS